MDQTLTPRLSIILPVFCEAGNIRIALEQVQKCVATLDINYEIIFIDDGSSDTSWEIIKNIAVDHPEVRGVRFSRNFGKEYALFAGLEASRGNVVITLDSDLQHPPEFIPLMFQMWLNHDADIINIMKRKRQEEPFFNRISAQLFYALFRDFSGMDLNNATDYKLLDRKVVDAICQFKETNIFYRGIITWLGFKHANITIDIGERKQGSGKWRNFRLIGYAIDNIVNYSSKPLILIGLFGILFFISALLLLGISTIRLITGTTLEGFTTVIILQLFIGAIIIASLTLIGLYLAKIYGEVKRRPKYIVTEQINGQQSASL